MGAHTRLFTGTLHLIRVEEKLKLHGHE